MVVSWKEAAEIHDSVDSDAFVIPRRSGSAVAGFPSAYFTTRSFSSRKIHFSTLCPTRNVVPPGSIILTRRSI